MGLTQAIMRSADLSGAEIIKAGFSRIDLEFTYLSSAESSGADVFRAGARVDADLVGAINFDRARRAWAGAVVIDNESQRRLACLVPQPAMMRT